MNTEQAKTVSLTFSFLRRYSIAKFENRVSAKSSTIRTPDFFFRYGGGCLKTPKCLFLPHCSFKICEKPSKFSKSVRVVIDVSA